jgi:methionine synthase I (cobalamin-dependent)
MAFDPTQKLTRENFAGLPPLTLDGAWGTEMARRGAEPGQMCDPWNLEKPETVFEVAKAYVDAGAQVILTNTFNSNRPTLERHGLADQTGALCRAGAEVSKRAAEGKAYVFASVGPVGKIVMMGEISADEVTASSEEQAAALAEGGADAIVIETQTDLVEAEAILTGCLKACDLPVGVSFTFDSGPDHDMTMMGVSVAQAYELARGIGASFVGANCGAGISTFPAIARAYRACGEELPIWIKGNAGLPEVDENGQTVFRAGPDVYRAATPEILEAGARFVGGCCGSTPDHIRAVADAMKAAQ